MRVYRNRDGFIVTYTPEDVEAFDPDVPPDIQSNFSPYISPLVGCHGFFEFSKTGTLIGLDERQPNTVASERFAIFCKDFAAGKQLVGTDLERFQAAHRNLIERSE